MIKDQSKDITVIAVSNSQDNQHNQLKKKSMFNTLMLTLTAIAVTYSSVSLAKEATTPIENTVPLTLMEFPTAETHHMMKMGINQLDNFGKWAHIRGFTPIDQQNVVRMNRDTLYSSMVLDLTEPATIIKPDTGDRYQSLLIINEGHFSKLVAYEAGEYTLTSEEMGSRYVVAIVRTLVDAEDPEDLKMAYKAQDGLQLKQKNIGEFDVPNWDATDLNNIRQSFKELGRYLPNRDNAYGDSEKDVDSLAHQIVSADAWGGWKPEHAVYQNFVVNNNDGTTPYQLTLKDIPSGEDAFWSISVYNEDGFFVQNDSEKYVINSRKAVTNEDGSVTINFGGELTQDNFLPITPGWSYMLRIYLPTSDYFDGSWEPAQAQLIQ